MAFLHVNMQKLHKNKTNANSAVNAKDRLQPPSERETTKWWKEPFFLFFLPI